jgi:hypothetical protein
MATYNTAFGVLPSPKTQLFGGNTGGESGRPAPAPAAPQPARPAAAMAPMGGTAPVQRPPTFAQLQQQGQPRPAPPPREVAPDAFMTARAAPQGAQLQAGRNFIDLSSPGATPWVTYGTDKGITSSFRPAGVEQFQYIRGPGREEVVENPWYQAEGGGLPAQVAQALSGPPMGAAMAEGAPSMAGVSPEMMASLQALFAQGGVAAPPAAEAMGVGGELAGGVMMASPAMAPPMAGGMGGTAPAGAPFALGQTFQQGTTTQSLTNRLLSQLTGMEQQGSVYDDPAFAAQRAAAVANLQAERQASEAALNEEMARRGIAASSIAAGRMGDIAGQFGRAQATLEADLLKEAMAREQQRQQFLVQQLGQTLGTVGEQELGVFRANVESARAQADIQARAAELQQNERLRGRELDLQQARDLATKEYQSGQLAMGYAEMGSRERLAANELAARRELQQSEQTFQAGQSALERSLREAMQTRELTAAEKRQLAEIEANKAQQERQFGFQRGESALERQARSEEAAKERQLREIMQTRELTAAEKRQLAEIEANKAQQERQFGFQRGESALERALRERMGLTEATGILYGPDGKPVLDASGQPVRTLAGQTFTAQQQQARNAFLTQLASVLAPMKEDDRQAFIRNLPPEIRALFGMQGSAMPGGVAGGAQTGGAYGVDTGI